MLPVILLLLLSLAAQPVNLAEDTLDLQQLIHEMLAANPEISALEAKLEALDHRIAPAGTLPDPLVGLTLMNYPVAANPFDIGRIPMTQTQFSVSQKIPFPGTLTLQRELARGSLDIGSLTLAEKRLALTSMLRKAYLDLYLLGRSIDIAQKNKTLLQEFIRIAETKYEVGKGLLQDVLKARVSLSRLLASIEALEQKRQTAKARINVFLNRDLQSPLGDPAPLETSAVDLDYGAALAEAETNRPQLRSAEAEIGLAETAVRLARKGLNPDFNLTFAYGLRYDDTDFWTLGFSLNLPLRRGSKQREVLAEKQAQTKVAAAKRQAERNKAALEIRKALDEIRRTDRQLRLYKDTVFAQAEMSLESAVSAYQVDKVDFLSLLDSQATLLNIELEYQRLLVEREASVVDLDAAVGRIPGHPQGAY
jgi:cobalt-zinc-cadmium efflux system outer membrane protein